MAARLNKAHQDDVRLKIKTSQLINRLQNFALELAGDPKTKEPIVLDGYKLKAIEILLRKSLPDLSSVSMELTGKDKGPIETKDVTAADVLEGRLNAIASRAVSAPSTD